MNRPPATSRAPMPCYRDRNMPSSTFRLFVILVIIVAAIIESPVRAFSHSRGPDTEGLSDDLRPAESSLVNVTNEPIPASTVQVVDTTNITKEIAARTSAKIYEIKGEPRVGDKVELTTAFILLKTDNGYLKITGLPIYTSSAKQTESLDKQDTTVFPGSTNSLTHKRESNKTDAIAELTTAIASEFTSSDAQSTGPSSSDLTTMQAPVELTIDATAFSKNTKLDIDNTFSETKSTEPIRLTTVESVDTKSTEPIRLTTVESVDTKSTEPIRLTTVESVDTTLQADITTSYKPSSTSNTKSTSVKATDSEKSEQNTPTPNWKKYTTIDRKRNDVSIEITKNVESTPTRVSLEKLLTDTSISSLAQLGETLDSKTTYAFDVPSSSPLVQQTVGVTPDVSTAGTTTTTKQTSPRTSQITSKRAGFLDYSAKPIAEEATTIIESYDTPFKFNESRGFSSMFEFEPDIETEAPETKNNSRVASQSQLAEDVIREEMMKEEMINNQAENANRYKEPDQLSVRPIDKTTLYSVGPNYKPMKKLDVQPAKPFIRSPDDLSWRNESISSLGIVFKAKPAAKNFTEVLKNKTETLFSNVTDKDSKNDIPDLRERLEKIAEVRKSKKKKVIDKFGETIYTDYEENSSSAETTSASTPTPSIATLPTKKEVEVTRSLTKEPEDLTTQVSVKEVYQNNKLAEPNTAPTPPPKKFGMLDYYDVTDEYDIDYLNWPKLDLKKYTTRLQKDSPPTTVTVATAPFQKPSTLYWPDRKPTLQYFPPRPPAGQRDIQAYDEEQFGKIKYFNYKDLTTKKLIPVPVTFTTIPVPVERRAPEQPRNKPTAFTKPNLEKSVYYTQPRVVAEPAPAGYDDGHYNKPTYVIKHYKDLIEKAAKDSDYEKDNDYESGFTANPLQGVTVNDYTKTTSKLVLGEDYDYDTNFRKDVIHRFVDNFNQNSERFKVDFPILYNSSVVHRKPEEGGHLATSSAFIKRLYEDMTAAKARARECEGCDRNVELPPAYELHYYVPEQEEKEEAESRSQAAYRYSL